MERGWSLSDAPADGLAPHTVLPPTRRPEGPTAGRAHRCPALRAPPAPEGRPPALPPAHSPALPAALRAPRPPPYAASGVARAPQPRPSRLHPVAPRALAASWPRASVRTAAGMLRAVGGGARAGAGLGPPDSGLRERGLRGHGPGRLKRSEPRRRRAPRASAAAASRARRPGSHSLSRGGGGRRLLRPRGGAAGARRGGAGSPPAPEEPLRLWPRTAEPARGRARADRARGGSRELGAGGLGGLISTKLPGARRHT